MAKTKHNNLLDTIDEIITDGKNKGILHLYTEDSLFSGRKIQIKGKNLFHFGTTGYLGLEQDERLKVAAIDAVRNYGTQFPLSKTYLSFGINKELEEHLVAMYHAPVLISKNSTLAHMAVIPTIVRDEDAVILDHQVHWSVQNACQMLKLRGITVDMIRHSSLEMLERKLKEFGNKYEKVWYMIDGVYSMFGDYAPIHELMQLSQKYPCLHIYADDVHGMSWAGKHGTGWVMSQFEEIPENMVLTATLSKSFGASGSVTVFPNEELLRKVKTFGGPLTFSAQLEPASVAAALASAKIHLSDEIYSMQAELADKIAYCNSLIKQTNLPLIIENECPVFFIGTGLPSTGYNFVEKLMREGFYVNLGVFPAVPVKNTGVRFTISRHNHKEDILALVQAMDRNYIKALHEDNKSQNDVRKKFNLPFIIEELVVKPQSKLNIVHHRSIEKISQKVWDNYFGDKGTFDYEGLKFLEKIFVNNSKPEENWDFHYFLVFEEEQLLLATFFTTTLWKEDMLAPAYVSKKVEELRKEDPYYLTSKVVSMGSLATEGEQMYLNKEHPKWKEAVSLLLESAVNEQESINASMVVLRDFLEIGDEDLKAFLTTQGFIKVTMPDTCHTENLNWKDPEEFVQSLSARSRKHIKTDVIKYLDLCEVEVKQVLTDDEIDQFYILYSEVSNLNFDLNYFKYPKSFIKQMVNDKNWEFIIIRVKPENGSSKRPIAGFCANYKNCSGGYSAVLLGMDYQYLNSHKTYKQFLYQIMLRAKAIDANKVFLGFSATTEKKKIGATVTPKVAFVQTKDNFKLELLNNI
ncbi:MAG: aminotransferase class I/II-fold pyridoxal phosphate-dependent enzyme [Bacteroidota bacterium]|nr:aminotransferase class I/II-fold pyridoxal phosphate-dependent enzyme [Bacteroidota bacterium]